MFHNLIFDWSGTVVDDLGPVVDATNYVFEQYGLEILDRESFRREFRLPYGEFWEEKLPHVSLEEVERLFRVGFSASEKEVPVISHARETLEACADAGVRMFVLSSMDSKAFQQQLKDHQLEHFFEATYTAVLDKRDVISQLLETHRLEPSETSFVGDMTHDIETAQHAGIGSIAVLTGYNDASKLSSSAPDMLLPDLRHMRHLVANVGTIRRPVATVGALIENAAGELLMIKTHKWSNLWGIPGGKIRSGESSLDALRREIDEETALSIKEIEFVCVQDAIHSTEFERRAHFLLLNYHARTDDSDVVLNDEAEEFRWVSLEEAYKLPLNQPTQTLLDIWSEQKSYRS